MPTGLLLTALVVAAQAAAPSHAAVRDELRAGDPCDGLSSIPDAPACRGEPLCGAQERVKLACQLRDALASRYVFFASKTALLGGRFDARAHLDAFVRGERRIAAEPDPLRFYDRLRRTAAAFQDGHLIVGAPTKLPQVALGVGLRLAEGKVWIANREERLVADLAAGAGAPDLEAALAVGAEVVAIDGVPVGRRLEELARYVPGSSRAARLERAADALTRRDFDYPLRGTARLTVLARGRRRDVELPWWIAPGGETHVMARAWAARTGVATTDLVSWPDDPVRAAPGGPGPAGALRTDAIVDGPDAEGLRELVDERGRIAARMGEVRRDEGAFCYLQLLTFHTPTLREGRAAARPYVEVVEQFVQGCGDRRLDLVLDLRQNEGGYLDHTTAIAHALGAAGDAATRGALLLRATTMNELVYAQRSPETVAAADDPLAPRHILDAIGSARRDGREFTPAFLEAPAGAGADAYAGRVVALTSPSCMSACDRLAALLRGAGRAVLLGGPTEGAGGSQQETRSLRASWTDAEGLVSVSIPNAAFGVEPRPDTCVDRREISSAEFFGALALENRPVEPHLRYATRRADLVAHGRGWLEQVEAVLFGPGPAHQAAPAGEAAGL
jgi:hypothetical protein